MFKRLLYIFLFLLTGAAAFAQQYPVQGSLAVASPYPANLSDYANSNIQNLALNLTLTDLTMANKRVRLKLFIQTQNATIAQSIDNISGEPLIMLDGGIPQRFTNTELAHYFRLENLQGINPDAYARSLPEGVYTIGFEVYDYFTGNKLSGRIAQTFWIIINDPPLLNSPTDKSKIADFTSGSGGVGGIIFNWTPRSTQVTNTEYEFTLCELWDPAGDPYQQFMSAIPKYQTTVANTTTLIYSLAQPSLISGYTYAWRVRAKAKAGFEDVGLYRNDGYSNLFTFRYGDPCPAPQSLALEAKTSDQISATWQSPPSPQGAESGVRYKLAYRKYSAAGQWSWAETETSDLFSTISGLEPATEYELKVGVPCNNAGSTAPLSPGRGDGGEVVYTPSQRATTLSAGKIAGIECGKEPTIDLSKQTLLTLLKVGDVVMANDFPTTISSVTGTSQGWSGEGWTKVPWLGDTRIHVTYASIKVNSDYKLIDGSFITTYDPTGKNIGDIDKTIDDAVGLYTGGTDVGKVVTGADATAYTVPYTITSPDIANSKFTTNGSGGGTITLGNGQTLNVSNLPTTVQDAAGTIYQADDKGKLTKVGNAGGTNLIATANLTVVDASKGTVTFAPTSDMKYAFDAWQKAYDGNSTWSKRYETLPISGQSGKYRVSSKLMVPGEADKVLAIINLNDKKLVADSVRFVNAKGTLFEKKKITDNSFELSLVGGPAGDAQEVYAIYPSPQGEGQGVRSYTLGKLLVATYEPKTINLALVPVNGAVLDSKTIAEELQKIYEPLGIDINLTTKDKFEYEALKTASLKVEGSGLLSVYTDQMKALNAAFVASGGYDKNTIYLFAIDQPESQDGKSIEGVMPRGQQFGYLFVQGKKGDEQGLTAAHEIGHGVFQLQHVFEYSGIKQKAITPLNVMDYPAGEALSKLQWDLMHDPGLVISVFETDKGVEKINATYNYLLPSHKPFRFKAGDGNLDDDCIVVNPPTNGNYPNGTLYSFVIGNTEYFYKSEDENFHSTDGKLYENAYTPSSAGNEFRLIAQDATDKCAYYLVKRLLKTSNYSAPDLSITTDAKKYYLCTKGKIPLNGNQSVSNSVQCIDLPADQSQITCKYLIDKNFIRLNVKCLEPLNVTKRKQLIEEIAGKQLIIGDDEMLLQSLMLSTPDNQAQEIHKTIKDKNLIGSILTKTQLAAHNDILNVLITWMRKYENSKTANKTLEYSENTILPNDGVDGDLETDGVTLKTNWSNDGDWAVSESFGFYDNVFVCFITPVGGFKKGITYKLSALEAYSLFNEASRNDNIKAGKLVLDVAMLAVGTGEISAAYRAYQTSRGAYALYLLIKAGTDTGMGLADITIQNTLATQWSQTTEGQKNLKHWNTICTAYMATSLTASAVDGAIKKLGIKTITNEDEFVKVCDELEEVGTDLGKIIYPTTKINGIPVVRIMTGYNGKIAIIGRKMPYIEDVANNLKKLGKEVEIFDTKTAFAGKGYNNLDEIMEDWNNIKNQFSNGIIPYEKVKQTLWYKENQRWARWIKEQGYDIYDLGDNPGQFINKEDRINAPDASAFYDLENNEIFNKK